LYVVCNEGRQRAVNLRHSTNAIRALRTTMKQGLKCMIFAIEPVMTSSAAAAAAYVREQVFAREQHLAVPPIALQSASESLTLIASAGTPAEPVAALSVIETSGEHDLHSRLKLLFPPGARVARFAQLAVLKPYRGLNLPARLILEARRRFVEPRCIDYTWLLFDARRAASSPFCKALGFRASAEIFATEYGLSRVLLRPEATLAGQTEDHWFQQYISASANNGHKTPSASRVVRWLVADEWLAQ
jgi:hypothetical protein